MPTMFYKFAGFLMLIGSSAAGLSVLYLGLNEYIRTRDKRLTGILVYILFINLMHVSAFLALSRYGVIFDIGRIDNPVIVFNVIVRTSALFTLPFFIHCVCPFRKNHRMTLLFLFLWLSLMAAIFTGIIPAGEFQNRVIRIIMFLPGIYTSLYGAAALSRIPRDLFKQSRDLLYALSTAGVFLLLVPFLLTMDFILIPLGLLPDHYQTFPFLALLTNAGFLVAAMIHRKWIPWPELVALLNREPLPATADTRFANRNLSPREAEIARLLADSVPNREIAARLGISESTAKTHIRHIYEKLGVNRRSDLAALAE
jgi:DNA-binding CsgD family transcriptional regulator